MEATAKTQELPPPGGYQKIHFARVPPKSIFKSFGLISGYIGITTLGIFLFGLQEKKIRRDKLEHRSSIMAVYPLLQAERDREYLKQLRRNRDEEAKLMANVEGWEVGTWYGEPIYRTLPKDTLVDPYISEYYVHAPVKDYNQRVHLNFWS